MTDAAPKPLTEEELQATIRMVEELRANLLQQANMSAGNQVLANTKRLVAEIHRLRQLLLDLEPSISRALTESEVLARLKAEVDRG